jgi:GntR family transcriptional regulator
MAESGGAPSSRREVTDPLWAQILAELRRWLSEGEFRHAFPGEFALVDEYGISRHTIRESLCRLRGECVVTADLTFRPREH